MIFINEDKMEKNKEEKTLIFKLNGNTSKRDWGTFTDQIISITKDGQTVILMPEDLRQLESVVGENLKYEIKQIS